jgi:ABC-type glycerol-3-phosphate transport system permease component
MARRSLSGGPRGAKPQGFTPARVGVYAFLVVAAAFFLLPAVVMVLTSLKTMDEIRLEPRAFYLNREDSRFYWRCDSLP